MRRHGYLLLVAISFLWNCNSPQPANNDNIASNLPQQPKDNYIVLMDLGNRILFNNQQQVASDIEIIKSICKVFKADLNSKDSTSQYYTVGDKIKLVGAPNWFYASVDLSAEQPAKRAGLPDKMEQAFTTLLPEIYKGVITANDDSAYSGAGIWDYFNAHLSDDLDKDAQNTLFIITDGYMSSGQKEDHPAQANRYINASRIIDSLKYYPDWETRFIKGDYGLPTIAKKFSTLKVVVLQLNPKEGWKDEYNLLTKIWDKWFTEMGITNYTLIKQDSSSSIAKASLARAMNIKIDTTSATEQWTQIKLVTTSDSFIIKMVAAEKKAADILKKTAPAATQDASKNVDSPVSAHPAGTRENTASNNIAQPAVSAPNLKTTDVSKKKPVSTPEVLPPDESDTKLLNFKKTDKAVKKTGTKNNDDILQDDAAANGFNTGIKKDSKKKDQ